VSRRLKTVNRTTFQQKDMNSDEILTYCFVYDMREPGDVCWSEVRVG